MILPLRPRYIRNIAGDRRERGAVNMAKRPVEPGIVKLGVRSVAVPRTSDVDCRHGFHPSCKSCFYFCSFLAAFAADGPKSRDIHDLPDRSPGLARVHACAKEARGWGCALRSVRRKAPVRATFMAEMQSYDSCAFTGNSQGPGGGI